MYILKKSNDSYKWLGWAGKGMVNFLIKEKFWTRKVLAPAGKLDKEKQIK